MQRSDACPVHNETREKMNASGMQIKKLIRTWVVMIDYQSPDIAAALNDEAMRAAWSEILVLRPF